MSTPHTASYPFPIPSVKSMKGTMQHNKGVKLRDFGLEYHLCLDNPEIESAMQYCGISEIIGEDITGVLWNKDNPEDIWFTESKEPYMNYAVFYQPKYWLEV